MYLVVKTSGFRKSLKRFSKTKNFNQESLQYVIDTLAQGRKLPEKYKDHELVGNFKGIRECHLGFDLLLMYEIDKDILILTLIDVGSHSYLFD